MALWTAEQLAKVRAVIARHHAAITIAIFGHKALPDDLVKDLRASGVPIPDGPQLIDDAFAYGQLVAILRDPKLATKSPAEVAELVAARKLPLQLTPSEKAAVEVARTHAGQYVVGLGTRVAGQVMAAVTGAEANLTPERMVEIIQDKTAGNIARRETIDSLRSDLGHAMGNWTRDWQRIAMTESNNAIQEGTAATIEKEHGADELVSKMPRPDACPDCKRLYLRGGEPIIFKLSELRANGSNVGRKKKDWKPTIEAVHPWCFPAGTLVLTSRGEIPIEEVQLGDVVFTHNGRWRAVHRLYRRAYNGKLIELGYGDKKLRTTPSHPIASGGGWISAGDIQEGAHLLHAPREVVFAEADHPPTRRGEKRRFAHVLQGLLWGRVPVAAVYFNGDLLIGVRDVDQESSDLVVRLRDAPELRSKDLEEQGFELRSDPTGLGGDLSQYFFFGTNAPTPRAVSGSGAITSTAWADSIHLDLGRFARGALEASCLADGEDNGTARATELFGDGLHAHVLIEVHATDDARIEAVTDSAHREDVAPACVDVTSRTSAPFNGTVYNLGVVEDESYAANGVIVHNCGCVLVRIPAGMVWEDGELVVPKKTVEKSELAKAARKLHGRLTFAGMPISIENRRGSFRHWFDPVAKEHGKTKVLFPYGYIRLTEATDGDHVDVYVGPLKTAPNVYVVHQRKKKPDGSFGGYDEDKAMLGFPSASAAKRAYLAHYNDPRFFGTMTAMTVAEFKAKLVEKRGQKLTKAWREPTPLVIDMLAKSYAPCVRCGEMSKESSSDANEPCWTCRKALEAAGTPYVRAGWENGVKLAKAGGPYIGPKGGKWADPEHTVAWQEPGASQPTAKHEPLAPDHEHKVGDEHAIPGPHGMAAFTARIEHVGDDHVRISQNHGDERRGREAYGTRVPKASVSHFVNDLRGVVHGPPSSDPRVQAVLDGKAEHLGKGDDGIAFRVGDNVVKASTTVPYQPFNENYLTPETAADRMTEQVNTSNAMVDAGVPGILRSELVRNGDKVFQIKPYVEIPDKLTREQLDSVADSVLKAHAAGYTFNDEIQVGIHDGKLVHFDTGKASKVDNEKQIKERTEDDEERLKDLFAKHGEKFQTTKEKHNPLIEWEAMTAKDPRKMTEAERSKHASLLWMHSLKVKAFRDRAEPDDKAFYDVVYNNGEIEDAINRFKQPDLKKAFGVERPGHKYIRRKLGTDGKWSYEYANAPDGIIAAHAYGDEHGVRPLHHATKAGDADAIERMAREMAAHVPANAVLIPMPGREGHGGVGSPLVEHLAKITGRPIADVLRGKPRASLYEHKKAGGDASTLDLGFHQTGALPAGMQAVVVDNVVGTGTTARAAQKAIPGAVVLVHAIDNAVFSPPPQLGFNFAPPVVATAQRQEAAEAGVKLTNYFASGSNHEGEIQGFSSIGWNVGVAAHEVSDDAVRALIALKGKGTKVFVDSGAFSEVDFNFPARKDNAKKGIKAGDLPYPDKPIGPVVVAPISDEEWDKRLSLYDHLAAHLGGQLYAVAPDKVAFQDDTADRLAKYADRVRAIHAKGANILVPLQKGKLSLADFDDKAAGILGFDDYIRAIPMKKDATTTAEFEAFMAAKKPARVHLLGIGEESDRYDEVMAAAKRASPDTEIFLDSVKITSAVERSKPTKAGGMSRPRKLTAATDRQIKRLADEAFTRDDIDEAIADPAEWLTPKQRGVVADKVKLNPTERRAFLKDPTAFAAKLRADDDSEKTDNRQAVQRLELDDAINGAWAVHFAGTPGAEIEQHHGRATTTERKREAIREAFGPGKLAHLKTRAEAMTEAVARERRPAHRTDADHYRWETNLDAESEHRAAVHHAVTSHEMTAGEYAKLHGGDYGPIADFVKDPMRGAFVAGKSPMREAIDVLKSAFDAMSAGESIEQLGRSPARVGMMSWRGNEDSPRPERPADIVGITDDMGLTVKGRKKRKKKHAEDKADARRSRLSPADRFAPAKRMKGKHVKVLAPDSLKEAREQSRDGAEGKRERIRDDLARRQANKPPVDPIRIARARGEA